MSWHEHIVEFGQDKINVFWSFGHLNLKKVQGFWYYFWESYLIACFLKVSKLLCGYSNFLQPHILIDSLQRRVPLYVLSTHAFCILLVQLVKFPDVCPLPLGHTLLILCSLKSYLFNFVVKFYFKIKSVLWLNLMVYFSHNIDKRIDCIPIQLIHLSKLKCIRNDLKNLGYKILHHFYMLPVFIRI